jgi:hypothetical protein
MVAADQFVLVTALKSLFSDPQTLRVEKGSPGDFFSAGGLDSSWPHRLCSGPTNVITAGPMLQDMNGAQYGYMDTRG